MKFERIILKFHKIEYAKTNILKNNSFKNSLWSLTAFVPGNGLQLPNAIA
jgi:hypothetical protein